jgi:PAS domain S-box-containing protein
VQSSVDFQQLVAAVGDAVIAADASGAITLWNPAAVRMFGYAEDEALGKSLDIITPHRHQRRHWDGYYKSMETGTTKYGNDVLRVPATHKDGRVLSIAFTVAMLFDEPNAGEEEHKKVSAIVAVIRDETAKFAEERRLKQRVNELEAQATPAQIAAGG